MKRISRIGIAAACVALPLTAKAADLGGMPPAYPVAPQVVASWTACYAGLNLGGGWAQATLFDPVANMGLGSVNPAGFVGGGQVGCDFQVGQFVFGVQGMASAADIRGTQLQPNGVFTTNFNIPWVETLTARVGFAVLPVTLLYVKGGGAWVRDNVWTSAGGVTVGTGIITPTGWTAGFGAEFLFYRNWSAFVEYDYSSFAKTRIALIPSSGSAIPIDVNHNVQTLLVGVNFRFGAPLSPSPASY